MSRENFQKYGLIAALIVAGITLPTSIVSFMREPTVVNNYQQNYNAYYNQTYNYNETYYESNETDYTKPIETVEYFNLDQYDLFVRNFTLSSDYVYWYHWNASTSFQLRYYLARGMFYVNITGFNGTIGILNYMNKIKITENTANSDENSFFLVPPFLSDWLIVYVVDDPFTVNMTLRDEIITK